MNKEILRLSVPAIVSNITVPLLGLCDTAISGHLGSDLYLAAIAVGSVMLNVVFWLFGFLRMGTTGLTATAFGAGDDSGVRKVFTRAMLLAGGAGVALILAREPVMDALMKLIGAESDVAGYVGRYFMIRIWGSPALLGVLAVSGWFVGMQSTAYPMVIAISVNIVNIAASFALVFWFGLGFEGVAWGTLVSNWVGIAIAMVCALRFSKGKRLWCGVREAVSGGGMGRFFSVNSNLFFRSACIICVTLGVTAAGARLGAATLAINVVVMQFFQFFSFFMDGFAFSGEALVGRWWGAGDRVMVDKYVRALLWWTAGVALIFTVCYGLGSEGITSLLTDSESVRQGVKGMRAWIWSLPAVSAWAFIYDGFYVGVTDTRKMMMSTLVATIVFYIVAFVKFAEGRFVIEVDSNAAVWTAFLSYLFIRGAFLAIAWHIVARHVKYTHTHTHTDNMIKFVNAKINLGLNIVRKREDGYHDLETVFFPVGIESGMPQQPEAFDDILEVTVNKKRTSGCRFQLMGRRIDCPPEKNLVVKATTLFLKAFIDRYGGLDEIGLFDITLDKHLPDGAGLGGGSADASFALVTLNELTGGRFSHQELAAMALKLGADCPFFIYNTPCFGEGVGEVLTPVDIDLKGNWLLIVKPDVYISTKEAFAGIIPRQPGFDLRFLPHLPLERWRGMVVNDFEESVFPAHPELGELKDAIYASGAVYASMSGSGSSIYGIFTDGDAARSARDRLSSTYGGVWLFAL